MNELSSMVDDNIVAIANDVANAERKSIASNAA